MLLSQTLVYCFTREIYSITCFHVFCACLERRSDRGLPYAAFTTLSLFGGRFIGDIFSRNMFCVYSIGQTQGCYTFLTTLCLFWGRFMGDIYCRNKF